jgi:hypothetical protein
LGCTEAALLARRRSAPRQLALAARLRKQTPLTVQRSAALAHWGTAQSAKVRRHACRRGGTSPASAQPNRRLCERMKNEPGSGLTPAFSACGHRHGAPGSERPRKVRGRAYWLARLRWLFKAEFPKHTGLMRGKPAILRRRIRTKLWIDPV